MGCMDPKTLAFYANNAADIAQRYESVASPVERYFSAAFMPGSRVLDIGCGAGNMIHHLSPTAHREAETAKAHRG